MKPFDIDRYDKMFIIDTNFLITFVSFEDRNITVLFVKEEHSLYNCFFLFFFAQFKRNKSNTLVARPGFYR